MPFRGGSWCAGCCVRTRCAARPAASIASSSSALAKTSSFEAASEVHVFSGSSSGERWGLGAKASGSVRGVCGRDERAPRCCPRRQSDPMPRGGHRSNDSNVASRAQDLVTGAKFVMDVATLKTNTNKPQVYEMRKKELEVKFLSGSTQKQPNGFPFGADSLLRDKAPPADDETCVDASESLDDGECASVGTGSTCVRHRRRASSRTRSRSRTWTRSSRPRAPTSRPRPSPWSSRSSRRPGWCGSRRVAATARISGS